MNSFKIGMIVLFLFFLNACNRFSAPESEKPRMSLHERRLNQLEQLQRTMVKVICSAYYENYYYVKPPSGKANVQLEELLYKKQLTTNSVLGSALILNRNPSKILLLSAYHIFDFEDTVRVYYKDENGNDTPDLLSLSIKYDQRIFITHQDGTRSFGHIISFDIGNDIVLLESRAAENVLLENPFTAPFASDKEIKFGREAYLVGYPKGFLYISKGLVSPAPYPNKFLISAPFNRGFSGGVVISFEEGKDTFFYLGMANSMAYDSQYVLSPDETLPGIENYRNFPYSKEAYVKELKIVNYGLTFAIKAPVIQKFLEKQRDRLRLKSFIIPNKL